MDSIKKQTAYQLLIIFALACKAAYCQTSKNLEPPTPQVEKVLSSVAMNYLGSSVSQERKLNNQTTVLYGLGFHYSFYSTATFPFGTRFIDEFDKYFGRDYTTQRLTPYVFAEVRHYTTLDKRAVRGRNIKANSANYFALVGELPFATGNLINVPNLKLAYPVGLKYGLRRPLGDSFYLEGSLGAFLKISSVQRSLQPRLDFSLNWHW